MITDKKYFEKISSSISKYCKQTPSLSSIFINDLCGSDIVFKCENFQITGSFKYRAATNAILNLTDEKRSKGVITHSSGNFAQALACAAKSQNIEAHIVMPENAPAFKKKSVEKYNNNLIQSKPTVKDRENMTRLVLQKNKLSFIHPSNNLDVILGNSTIATELLSNNPNLDFILCPVGGGGLLSGLALSSSALSEKCEVIGVEPINVNDAYRSIISKQIETNKTTNTIADGLRTNLGNINFPIILKHVNKIICVQEEEIIDAMHLIHKELGILVEPSGAVSLAGLLKEKKIFKNKKIAVVISGGNVDPNKLPFN